MRRREYKPSAYKQEFLERNRRALHECTGPFALLTFEQLKAHTMAHHDAPGFKIALLRTGEHSRGSELKFTTDKDFSFEITYSVMEMIWPLATELSYGPFTLTFWAHLAFGPVRVIITSRFPHGKYVEPDCEGPEDEPAFIAWLVYRRSYLRSLIWLACSRICLGRNLEDVVNFNLGREEDLMY